MHSWDIIEWSKNRMLLCTLSPVGYLVTIQWAKAWKNLQLPPGSDTLFVQGMPWGEARSYAVILTLNRGYSWLGFLDADIIATPPDLYIKLMNLNLPIVSALYHQKFKDYLPAVFNETTDEKGNFRRMTLPAFNYGDIIPADLIPAGCCLIHRSVLEKFKDKGIYEPYEWRMKPGTNPLGFSEDYWFSHQCKHILGIQPMLATGMQVEHEIMASVSAKGLKEASL